jgi:hypothetical protein
MSSSLGRRSHRVEAQELLDAARPLQQRILPQHGNFLKLPRAEISTRKA